MEEGGGVGELSSEVKEKKKKDLRWWFLLSVARALCLWLNLLHNQLTFHIHHITL